MLEIIIKSTFSNDFIAKENGVVVAKLDLANWSQTASVEIEGATYDFKKTGLLNDIYTLYYGGLKLLEVEQPSAWNSKLIFHLDQKEYVLDTKNWFSSAIKVEQDGNVSGDIHSTGLLTSTIVVDLPDTLPLSIRVFVGWIAILRSEEMAAAAIMIAT